MLELNGGSAALAAPPAIATLAITAGIETIAPAIAERPPGGQIAYTVLNPRTDRLDTVIYSLATGVRWPVLENARQPDFNNQSDLALNGEGGNADNLLLMRPGGEILLDIMSAHAEDAHPHWAPNNKKIVFDSRLVGDGRYRLYLQRDDAYGQQVGPLMFDAWEIFGRYPIFLLDDRIAYNGCDVWENGSTCGVYVVDIYGGQPSGLTQWPRDIPTDNMGPNILAMSDRGGNWDVYLINATSGAVEQLTDDPSRDGLATASPDGSYIAFVTDREGAWAVYIMHVDGSNPRKLFDLTGDYGRDDRDWLQERLSWGR
jgi:TolB protein